MYLGKASSFQFHQFKSQWLTGRWAIRAVLSGTNQAARETAPESRPQHTSPTRPQSAYASDCAGIRSYESRLWTHKDSE